MEDRKLEAAAGPRGEKTPEIIFANWREMLNEKGLAKPVRRSYD
jgi:hypothetical protein